MAGEHAPMTPMGGLKAFSCRNCGGQVELLAPGQTLTAACKHCRSITDLTDPNLVVIQKAKGKQSRDMVLEIGIKGTFEGKTWQVIGYQEREVPQYEFQWGEYLLFNPRYGFRFLSHAYGHWSWIRMVRDMPIGALDSTPKTYQGQRYRHLTDGKIVVNHVMGEFYWKVKVGEKVEGYDFIAPPLMLSAEFDGQGIVWSQGEYLEPRQVREAFGIDGSGWPSRSGIAGNQPNPFARANKVIIPAWIVSMVALVALGLGLGARFSPDKAVATMEMPFPQTSDVVSLPFDLGGNVNNAVVEVEVESGLDNHWVEVEGVLHNIETNENYGFVATAEYYYGVTDGESWSEGSRFSDATLNEVPPGKYELVVTAASDWAGTLKLTVRRGVPILSNWLMAMLLLTVVPAFTIWRSKAFEKKRSE